MRPDCSLFRLDKGEDKVLLYFCFFYITFYLSHLSPFLINSWFIVCCGETWSLKEEIEVSTFGFSRKFQLNSLLIQLLVQG